MDIKDRQKHKKEEKKDRGSRMVGVQKARTARSQNPSQLPLSALAAWHGHDAPSTTGVRMGVMGNNEVNLVVGAQ